MDPILSSGVRKTRPQEKEIPGGKRTFSLVRRWCFPGRRSGLEARCCPDSADARKPCIRCGIEHPHPMTSATELKWDCVLR